MPGDTTAPAGDVSAKTPSPNKAVRPTAVVPRADAVPPELQAQAAAAFSRALELQAKGDPSAALNEFERAYDILPAYEVLYFVGALSAELGRWARARRAFEGYLALGEGKLLPDRIAEVRLHLAELEKRTATLTLILNVSGVDVHIDGTPVESTQVSGLILDTGTHVLRVSKPGFQELEQTVHAVEGENLRVVLPLLPSARTAPEPAGTAIPQQAPAVESQRSPTWLPWAVTGALGAGWATTAALAIKARHDRNIIERPGTSAERIDDARHLHETLAVVSDILLAATLASAGVSAYLTWWSEDTPANRSAGGLEPDGAALGISGQF